MPFAFIVARSLVIALSAFAIGEPHEPATTSHTAVTRAAINDNRRPAGRLRNGVLMVHLEARLAEWHPDGESAPGAVIPAFGERGRTASIPGPLIRVPAGTEIAVSLRNALSTPVTIHGLHARSSTMSATAPEALELAPGASRDVRFRLDVPGTYYYYGSTKGALVESRYAEDSQLTGAIVVDPPGVKLAPDRIFVIGVWSDTVGRALTQRTRVLAVINGRSWPHTERMTYDVGDTVRWRLINASADFHPMHLHGFYYRVVSRGDGRGDTSYAEAVQRRVNTEPMAPATTMTLSWIPERPGNWLFHCHLPEHFMSRGPLGMPPLEGDHSHGTTNHALSGMNGLVMGVTVRARRGDVALQSATPGRTRRELRLIVRPTTGGTPAQPRFAVGLERGGIEAPVDQARHIGPALVLTRDEPASITVVNKLDAPTAIHWHGIELESYFDGVAGFSGAGRRLAPVIAPHDSFVARFTPPRSGTFIYHTHIDEKQQQLAGLAGPLIVVDPGTVLDTLVDHSVIVTTPPTFEDEKRGVLLNGSAAPAQIVMQAHVPQRLRFINMTITRPGMRMELWRDSTLLSWRPLAKDGADLPEARRIMRPARSPMTIGDTMDFEFLPDAPGSFRLEARGAQGELLGTLPIRVIQAP